MAALDVYMNCYRVGILTKTGAVEHIIFPMMRTGSDYR